MGCANTSADEVLLFFDDMQSDIYCPFLSPAFIRRLYLKLGHKWLGKGSSTLVTGPKNAQFCPGNTEGIYATIYRLLT